MASPMLQVSSRKVVRRLRVISFPLVPDPREGPLGPFLEHGDRIGRQISGPTTVPRVDTSQHGFVIAIDQVDKALEVIRVGVGERKDLNPATVPGDNRLGGRAMGPSLPGNCR